IFRRDGEVFLLGTAMRHLLPSTWFFVHRPTFQDNRNCSGNPTDSVERENIAIHRSDASGLSVAQFGLYQARARTASATDGCHLRTCPTVDSASCPRTSAVSSPGCQSCVRIESISAWWLPFGYSVRWIDP